MNVLPRGLLGGESETPSCTDREKVVALFPLTRGSCFSLLPSYLPRGLLGGESEAPSCTDREKVAALFPLTRGSCSSLLPLSISWAQWFTLPSEQASREYGLSLCHLLGKQPLCEQASREHGLSLCPLLGKQPLLNFRKCRFFIRTIVLNANFLVYI